MEGLLEREKHCRLNGNKDEMEEILKGMIDLCTTPNERVETIRLMSKKKGQIKDALYAMIMYAYTITKEESNSDVVDYSFKHNQLIEITDAYTDNAFTPLTTETNDTSQSSFLAFLNDLLDKVIEGKIYLERVRVIVTDSIKQILISQGKGKQALETIYSVNIETFSLLTLEEIIQYQLEQMRLAILIRDKDKAQALAKKFSVRQLEEVPHLKEYYYNRMIFIYIGEKDYVRVADIYNQIRKTEESQPKVQTDSCVMIILYAILSLHSPEAPALIKSAVESKLCPDSIRVLGELFISMRLISLENTCPELSDVQASLFKYHQEEIHQRVIEHNLIVISSYYSCISIDSVAKIFNVSEDTISNKITEMIRNKLIFGHVDQMSQSVTFNKPIKELEEWANSIDKCLELIIKITHNICKTN
ncbi:26S proteasome regulatory subunit N5 [Nematocida sp. AWRm80]|nr:26S proteasome regulatory subunit N5 [Nematocida sp. AWRm80]